jgi:UV DNA damage endonuclease
MRMPRPGRARAATPQLGLVCQTSTEEVRFRTITRSRFLALPEEQKAPRLRELYEHNLRRLYGALAYCNAHGIHLYRASCQLFPIDDPPRDEVLVELAPAMAGFADRARRLGVRVLMHPDQFVVLSSDSPNVVETSVQILSRHARVFDYLGLPRSPWSCLILHGGKGGRSDRLIETIGRLPESARSRLVLENDESAYGAAEILDVCRRAGVPMVFDAHHHLCREKLDSYDHPSIAEFTAAARDTWPRPEWQLVHISNGLGSFCDPRHSDTITTMPEAFEDVPWIEVEAKAKEQAVVALRRMWPPTRFNGARHRADFDPIATRNASAARG